MSTVVSTVSFFSVAEEPTAKGGWEANMNRPVVSTARAILFRRAYTDDSGMPDYPQGTTRCEIIPFDTDVQKLFLVSRIIDHPEDFEPYFIGPIRPVHVHRHGDEEPYQALEFAMSTKLDDELRDKDVPRYVNHIDTQGREADHDHEVSMTFDVSHHVAKLELARWIEAKLFHAFVHTDAAIYYTAITKVTEPWEPVPVPVAGSDTDAQMLRRISNELFAVKRQMPDHLYVRLSNALKRRRPD